MRSRGQRLMFKVLRLQGSWIYCSRGLRASGLHGLAVSLFLGELMVSGSGGLKSHWGPMSVGD